MTITYIQNGLILSLAILLLGCAGAEHSPAPNQNDADYESAEVSNSVASAAEYELGESAAAENAAESVEEAADRNFPRFPWPVPDASAQMVLSRNYFAGLQTLEQVDDRLTSALMAKGYDETGRYRAPNGFVLVTRIERFRSDGTLWAQAGRFDFTDSRAVRLGNGFAIRDYLDALLRAPVGRYRVIAFVVSNIPVTQSRTQLSAEDASDIVSDGGAVLPQSIAAARFTAGHRVTVLIYEYERPQGRQPVVRNPGTLQGTDHMTKSGLLARFGG